MLRKGNIICNTDVSLCQTVFQYMKDIETEVLSRG